MHSHKARQCSNPPLQLLFRLSAPDVKSFPPDVRRWIERSGELEEVTLHPAQLETRVFYRLHR